MNWMIGGGIFALIYWILSLIVQIGVAALVIFGILKLINYYRSGGSLNSNSSLEILKRRYASGEINQEEFERMKQELDRR